MGSKNDSTKGSAGEVTMVIEIVDHGAATTRSGVRSGACASASGGPRQSLFNGTWVACATYNIIGCKVNGLSEGDKDYLYELAESLANGMRTCYMGNPVNINPRVLRFLEKRLVTKQYIQNEDGVQTDKVEILMDDDVRDIVRDLRRTQDEAQASIGTYPMPIGQVIGQA